MNDDKYLVVELIGGLCNKLYCFFSAVEIALANGYILVEPNFGWKVNVKMSNVWNVEKICAGIPELKWCSLIEFNNGCVNSEKIIYKTGKELWDQSELKLKECRLDCRLIRSSDICCRIVSLLEPAECVLNVYGWDLNSDLRTYVAVHFRTESDWRAYSVRKQRKMPYRELCFVENDDIINMVVNEFDNDISIFIVNGECGNEIKNKCLEKGIIGVYDYKSELEYEQNAAMHWWICCICTGGFVGLCRSTFSNLVCLRRVMDNVTGYCWVYNYSDVDGCKKLFQRVDAGLHCDAYSSITKITTII